MTNHTDTPVTAIIVSTGWLGLKNAVQSVTRQTIPVTPLIVLDKPQAETSIRRRLAGLHYRLITTRGEEGLAASRNIGVEAATTEYIAFLDERDAWVSHKTHTQLDALRQATATWGTTVISSRSLRVQQTSRITPERLYVPGTPIGNYVMDRSTVRLRRCLMPASTLICHRETAEWVPWDDTLVHQEDWDWLVRLQEAGVRISQLDDVLVRVFPDPRGAADSRASSWQDSLSWLQSLPATVSDRARGDFTTSVIARGAFESGALALGAKHLLKGMYSGAHPTAAMIGLAGLMYFGRHKGHTHE